MATPEDRLGAIAPTHKEKKEFREYLHKTGIFDTMMRLLATLYESKDKPTDETKVEDFIRANIGELIGIDIESLKKENEALKSQNRDLQKRCSELETRCKELEAAFEK